MAYDYEKLRWASVNETDPISGENNKSAPPAQVKSSGLKRYQAEPRQWNNYLKYETYEAIKSLQDQITNLTQADTDNQALLQLIFSVGDVWVTKSGDDPAVRFGFGTWEKVEGKFIVSTSSTDADFSPVGKTGGVKTHTHNDNFSVNSHTLTEAQVPTYVHNHDYRDRYHAENIGSLSSSPYRELMPSNYNNAIGSGDRDGDNNCWLYYDTTTETDTFGGGGSHSHGLSGGVSNATVLPPYEAMNVWERVA